MKWKKTIVIPIVIMIFMGNSAWAETIESVLVEKIIDGDSLLVRSGNKRMEIRLWGIDTPEYRQPYSKKAKKLTRKLLEGKVVNLYIKDRDKYGRLVAMVTTENQESANEILIKKGLAWVHIRYCQDSICDSWRSLQDKARAKRLGLWREKNPVAPWVWKRSNKR